MRAIAFVSLILTACVTRATGPAPAGPADAPEREGGIPEPAPGANPTRWEYLCTGAAHVGEAGLKGWELISIAPSRWSGSEFGYQVQAYHYCFRRPLAAAAAPPGGPPGP